MHELYPAVEPYDRGMLDVGNGHRAYWECCGNPDGKAALYLHGGPGSGSSAAARRVFDPERYRIVLFDQRGCGRSLPLLATESDLLYNTTQHLIRDVESLRSHLSVDRWVVVHGASWGTTLALAYAQSFPERIAALVLACVTTTSRREVEWLTRGVARLFPQQWERFAAHIPDRLKHLPVVDAYATLLFDGDSAVCATAAEEWCRWEDAHVSLAPGHTPNKRFLDPDFRLRFSRIVTHYWRHAAFLKENQLLENIDKLNAIPATLIHGSHDVSSPLETASELHARWPGSHLVVVADAGHGGGSMSAHVVSALDDAASDSRVRSK